MVLSGCQLQAARQEVDETSAVERRMNIVDLFFRLIRCRHKPVRFIPTDKLSHKIWMLDPKQTHEPVAKCMRCGCLYTEQVPIDRKAYQ